MEAHLKQLHSALDESSEIGQLAFRKLAELQAEIVVLRKTLNLPKSKLYTMPEDLLSRIFSEVQKLEEHCKGAYRVSQVCKRWRKVSLDNGSLWADVKLEVRKRGAYENLQLFIARSNRAALDVTLDCSVRHGGRRREEGEPEADISHVQRAFMALIVAERHRLRTFHLIVQNAQQLGAISDYISTQEFPRLETLQLATSRYGDIFDWQDDITGSAQVAMGGSSMLRTIVTSGCDILAFRPSLQTVTNFSIQFRSARLYTYEDIYSLLTQMPLLEDLSLSKVKVPTPPSQDRVCTTNLKKLDLYKVSAQFFQYIVAPNLHEMEVNSVLGEEDQIQILPSQFPTLQELKISSSDKPDMVQLTSFFESILTVRKLTLPSSSSVHERALVVLMPKGRRNDVLPVLEHLVVDEVSQAAFCLLGRAASRVTGTKTVPRLTLDSKFVALVEKQHPGAMEWFAAQGVKVDTQEDKHRRFGPWSNNWNGESVPWSRKSNMITTE